MFWFLFCLFLWMVLGWATSYLLIYIDAQIGRKQTYKDLIMGVTMGGLLGPLMIIAAVSFAFEDNDLTNMVCPFLPQPKRDKE